MKLKKLITENEVKTKQPLFTKTFNQRAVEQQKSSGGSLIERRAGRGSIAGGCCGTGGVIVSENPSSSSIVMGFSTDPSSSQGKRKSSTG